MGRFPAQGSSRSANTATASEATTFGALGRLFGPTEPMQNTLAAASAFRRTSVALTLLSLVLVALLAALS